MSIIADVPVLFVWTFTAFLIGCVLTAAVIGIVSYINADAKRERWNNRRRKERQARLRRLVHG
jgi:hypothetical protein